MESRHRAAETLTQAGVVRRFRLMAACLVLTAIAFIQQPGRIVPDTKLDLVVDPGSFLVRALSMWDPEGAFGQIQNQAYGYLFPMGSFFGLGHQLGLEPWIIQRLWWAAILCVAFLGVYKLAGVLEIGAPWTRIVAGLAYALSPRLLTVIGPASVEVWPAAVAPWVLIPLVLAVRRDQPWRYAGLSALAVAAAGGVNAAATFAVVPLAALWILFSPRGPTRRKLMLAWPPLVLLGTLWWIVPLFLLGSYSPPFLGYIETASATSLATDLFNVLRGTVHWVPYVDPTAVGGSQLVRVPIIIVNSALVMILGLVGLVRRDIPHRAFLVAGLIAGVAVVAMAHDSPAGGLLAPQMHDLLDGPLAALRNTHKFELMVRLPLVLGLAHLLTQVTRRVADSKAGRPIPNPFGVGVTVLAVAALLGATAPAWSGGLANRGSVESVPDYWSETAHWLDTHGEGTALMLPASSFADYTWGRTIDEPMQPLADSPWAVRNLIPLAPGANIEMLDAISAQVATGQGGSGLEAFLRRAGVSHLVVRNDLDRAKDIVDPELVYAALESMPGVESVASFGPILGGEPFLTGDDGDEMIVNEGWQRQHPAVEIFAIPGPVSASRQASDTLPVLIGGPRSLMTLDSLGITPHTQTVFAQDQPTDERPASVILADGIRRQEAGFGTVTHNRSSSLARGDPYSIDRPVHRYDQDRTDRWLSTPRLLGARRLLASSSQSDVDVVPFTEIAHHPWAAFDDDPDTTWRASRLEAGKDSWIELELDGPTDLGTVNITLGTPKLVDQELTVTTENGPETVTVQGGARTPFAVGTVSRLRISGIASFDIPLAISDVDWDGKALSRPLVMPDVPEAWGAPDRILISDGEGYVSGCLKIDGDERCGGAKSSEGEDGRTLDRQLDLPDSTPGDTSYRASLRVAPRGTAATDQLLQVGKAVAAEASSRVSSGPGSSPVLAIDGSRSTGWIASLADPDPALTVRWLGARAVDRIDVDVARGLPASTPTSARLEFTDGSSRTVRLVNGSAEFDPVTADGVVIHFEAAGPRANIAFGGAISALPIGVSEVDFPGLGLLPSPVSGVVAEYPCGSGPTISIDGSTFATSIKASPQDLLAGGELSATICDARNIRMSPGTHRVVVHGTDAFRPTSLMLIRAGSTALDGAYESVASDGGRYQGSFGPPAPGVLVTTHNTNRGWQAESGRAELEPLVVNGWQQAWRTPTRAAVVETYGPETAYRWSLGLGLVGVVALVILSVLMLRRYPRRPMRAAAPEVSRPKLALVLLAGLGMAVSPVGVACAVLGASVMWLFARRGVDGSWLAAFPLVTVAIWAAMRPWAGPNAWVGTAELAQLLVAFSLGALVAGGRPTERQR